MNKILIKGKLSEVISKIQCMRLKGYDKVRSICLQEKG